MKIRLIKPARVRLDAGSVIDTDPEQANFLLSVGLAAPAHTAEPQTEEKPTKRAKKTK